MLKCLEKTPKTQFGSWATSIKFLTLVIIKTFWLWTFEHLDFNFDLCLVAIRYDVKINTQLRRLNFVDSMKDVNS